MRKGIVLVLVLFLGGCLLFDGRRHDRLPADADLTIVHLTDLHLSSHGGPTQTPWTHKIIIDGYKLHRPCTGRGFEFLEKAVAQINRDIKPDVVVVTGDLIDRGSDREALTRGAEILRRLTCPVVMAKGDHDVSRSAEDRACWRKAFGAPDGLAEVNGFPFFYLPFKRDAATLARVRARIEGFSGQGQFRVFCLHRMLHASPLMDFLAKRVHGCSVLDTDAGAIAAMLEKTDARWLVLCGHSHTDDERSWGSVTQFCTASLAEYPHTFRIIKIKGDQIATAVVGLAGGAGE